jgi:hypothetical protein
MEIIYAAMQRLFIYDMVSTHNLEKSWCYLDGFEGVDYERVVTTVTLANGAQV